MAEYFDITFIADAHEQQKEITDLIQAYLFKQFKLTPGRNRIESSEYSILINREIVLFFYESAPGTDLIEFCISLSDMIFHKSKFESELKELTYFVEDCFQASKYIVTAVCGYEKTISINKISDIDKQFLLKFPMSYLRQHNQQISISINLDAQDIFTTQPITFFIEDKPFEKNDKRRLYWLIGQYLTNKMDAWAFCKEYHECYDVEINPNTLTPLEAKMFAELSIVAGRFLLSKKDHIQYPEIYYNEEELRHKITDAKKALNIYIKDAD